MRNKLDYHQLGGFRMNYDIDWLNFLKEFTDPQTGTASLITNVIPGGTGFPDSGDDDFFLYWFLST
jgi:hypothetical protein